MLVPRKMTRFVRDAALGQRLPAGADFDCGTDAVAFSAPEEVDYVVQLNWLPASLFEWHRHAQRIRIFWLERSASNAD